MAEDKKTNKRTIKKTETVRQKAEKATATPKTRRLQRTASSVKRPLVAARQLGRKEYHPVKLPDNKVGRFLTKPRRVTPKFLREAWGEVKQVSWPSRRETLKLTLAVFIFATVFGLLIAVTDYGLDKLFKQLLTK